MYNKYLSSVILQPVEFKFLIRPLIIECFLYISGEIILYVTRTSILHMVVLFIN